MWKQAQLEQWQRDHPEENEVQSATQEEAGEEESSGEEYTDYSDGEEEEEEPLQIAAWGNQAVNSNATTSATVGWDSLIDPNVKVPTHGVGSGNLHRRGGNYIPVDESLILKQRLGQPIPKGAGGKKKKKKSKSKPGIAPRPVIKHVKPTIPTYAPPPSTIANRSRAAITTGPWASGNLSSTPFWESNTGSSSSKYAPQPTNAPPVSSAPVHPPGLARPAAQQIPAQWGQQPEAQKQPPQQAPPQTPRPYQQQVPAQWGQQTHQQQIPAHWGQQPAPTQVSQPQQTQQQMPSQWGQQPQRPPQQQQPSSQWGQQPPASVQTQTQLPAPSKPVFEFRAPPPTLLGSAASKYAPFSVRKAAEAAAAQLQLERHQQQLKQQQQQEQQQQQQPVSQQSVPQQPVSQQPVPQYTSPQGEASRAAVADLNIQITQGVSWRLVIYDNDDPVTVVEQFAHKCRLTLDDTAKLVFAEKVRKLMQEHRLKTA